MARLPRLTLAGEAHLLVLRGHRGAAVFGDDADRRHFLDALRDAVREHACAVEAYVLAADHVHLLLRPTQAADLSAAVQALGRRYVAGFNRRHGRSGTLWAGRFRAAPLQAGDWVLRAMLFIDGHALRHAAGPPAAAVDGIGPDWPLPPPWCSAAHHLGVSRDPLVADGPAWWALGNTPFEREAAYRTHWAEGLSAAHVQRLAAASHGGWPLGDAAWLARVAAEAPRPVRPRPRGRPKTRTDV